MSLDTVKKEGNIKEIGLRGNKLKRSILSLLTTDSAPCPLPSAMTVRVDRYLISLLFFLLSVSQLPGEGGGRRQIRRQQNILFLYISSTEFHNARIFFIFILLQPFLPGLFLCYFIQHCIPCRPSDSLRRMVLGLNLGLLRLWHWQSYAPYNHSAIQYTIHIF